MKNSCKLVIIALIFTLVIWVFFCPGVTYALRPAMQYGNLAKGSKEIEPGIIMPSIPDNVFDPAKGDYRQIFITENDDVREELLGLPFRAWGPKTSEEIRLYKEYYRGIVKDIRLYTDGAEFKVLLVLNSDKEKNGAFISDPKKFNRNIIGHFSRTFKVIRKNLESLGIGTHKSRQSLAGSQIAVYYTMMECLSKRFSNIYGLLFKNGTQELLRRSSNRIPEEYRDSYILKDILAKMDVFDREVKEIKKYVLEGLRSDPSSSPVDLDIYDIAAAGGQFGAVAAERLDRWAKERGIVLNATFYLVDPDVVTFEKSGRAYYEECKRKYRTGKKGYGLNFSYVIPGETEEGKNLGNGYAEKAEFKKGAIAIANDFYEHIEESVQSEILSNMARQSIALHIVHVPFEKKPDPTWGHIRTFDSEKLSKLGDIFSVKPKIINENNGKAGFLVIKNYQTRMPYRLILTQLKREKEAAARNI